MASTSATASNNVRKTKNRFYKRIQAAYKCKFFNRIDYINIVDAFICNKEELTSTIYSKYSIMVDKGTVHVMEKPTDGTQPKRKYVPIENVFDVLHDLHTAGIRCAGTVHMGLSEMLVNIKKKYVMPGRFADIMLKSCALCANRFHSLVDIVNMEAYPDETFRYILIYTNESNKFMLLRPLSKLNYKEICMELYKIFLTFQPPVYIRVDLSFSDLIEQAMWRLRNVAGCSVEVRVDRQGRKIQAMHDKVRGGILSWMQENSSPNWGIGCHLLQFKMNTEQMSKNSHSLDVPHLQAFSNAVIRNPGTRNDNRVDLSLDDSNRDKIDDDDLCEGESAMDGTENAFGKEKIIDESILPDEEKEQMFEEEAMDANGFIKHEIEITENFIKSPEEVCENSISTDIDLEATGSLLECREMISDDVSDENIINIKTTDSLIECRETATKNVIQQDADNAINCDKNTNEQSDANKPWASEFKIKPRLLNDLLESPVVPPRVENSNIKPTDETRPQLIEELVYDVEHQLESHLIIKQTMNEGT